MPTTPLTLQATTWPDIEAVRGRIMAAPASTVEAAAQSLADDLCRTWSTIALARLFIVLPLAGLPKRDQQFAAKVAGDKGPLADGTPVLSLLGTAGRELAWGQRTRSRGHLAIPLVSAEFVDAIPMVAKLLADLDVDLARLDDGLPSVTRRLLGGHNGAFYVHDALTDRDARGRLIIPSREFVEKHTIRTVFGMGGAYVDGTLAVIVVFTQERLERVMADRFPSLISNFKMATARLLAAGQIYREPPTGGANLSGP